MEKLKANRFFQRLSYPSKVGILAAIVLLVIMMVVYLAHSSHVVTSAAASGSSSTAKPTAHPPLSSSVAHAPSHSSMPKPSANPTHSHHSGRAGHPIVTPPSVSLLQTSTPDAMMVVQHKLSRVEWLLKSDQAASHLQRVATTLVSIQHDISTIQTANQAQFQQLRHQITDLSTQLAHANQQTQRQLTAMISPKAATCLPASVLPFQVVAIDRLASVNVISVSYAHHIQPLQKDFSLAGWRVMASDYAHQQVRFQDAKGRCAAVQLHGGL